MKQIVIEVSDQKKAKMLLELLAALDFVESVKTNDTEEIKTTLAKIKQHLSLLFQYPLDTSVSEAFLQLTYALSHKLSIPDALIAATAQVHNLELYTLNLKDFQFIQNLKLYQPAGL